MKSSRSEIEYLQPPRIAERFDHERGYHEQVSFVTVNDARIFSVRYLPLTPARIGVVICHPILMEHMTNYRYEVLLARELAARGMAVQRFHYRGTGHSEGDENAISIETMVDDTLAVVGFMQTQTSVTTIAFHGTRWGGLVAAGAAAVAFPRAAALLWEPVVDPERYFRELIRARLVREIKDSVLAERRAEAWTKEMERDGHVDILGYALSRRLCENSRGRLDEVLLTGGPRPILVVQIGRGGSLRPDFARLKLAVERVGGRCDVYFHREEPSWMFAGHRLKAIQELVKRSADWLANQHE